MTLSELADALARPEKRTTVIERLAHWAELDYLTLDGKKKTGTGRARQYAPTALHEAKVIHTLVDLGIPVTAKPKLVRKVLKEKRLQCAARDLLRST